MDDCAQGGRCVAQGPDRTLSTSPLTSPIRRTDRSYGVEYEVDCTIFATGFEVGAAWTRRAGYDLIGIDCFILGQSEWDWQNAVNIMGVVHGVEIFARLIAAHGEGGHIVNTASGAGRILVERGIDPLVVGQRVLEAVKVDEGYVLTHWDFRDVLEKRTAASAPRSTIGERVRPSTRCPSVNRRRSACCARCNRFVEGAD